MPTEPTSPIVLVHGAWHGGWSWEPVATLLRSWGRTVHVLDLPGKDRNSGRDDLTGHAHYLETYLKDLGEPATVCAHSYGGAVVSEANLDTTLVGRIVMLSAFMLEPGECCMDMNDSGEDTSANSDLADREGGYVQFPAETALEAFYNEVDADVAKASVAKMTPENNATVYQAVTNEGWKDIPCAYVQCTLDRAIVPSVQERMAARAGSRYRVAGGHSAMMSHATDVAAIVLSESLRDV